MLVAWLIYMLSVKNNVSYPLDIGSHHFQLHIPFYIGNMFHGLAFYALGAWLKEKQFSRIIFVVAIFLCVVKYFFPANMDFRANDTNGSNYFLCVIYELSGCVAINNVFRYIADRKIVLLSHIGKSSMVYYLVHYPFMKIICYFFYAPFAVMPGAQRYVLLSVMLIMALVLSDFLFRKKLMRWMVGG